MPGHVSEDYKHVDDTFVVIMSSSQSSWSDSCPVMIESDNIYICPLWQSLTSSTGEPVRRGGDAGQSQEFRLSGALRQEMRQR